MPETMDITDEEEDTCMTGGAEFPFDREAEETLCQDRD